ncbi:hypothetical protein ACR788_20335 [Sphingobacterium siyangense]
MKILFILVELWFKITANGPRIGDSDGLEIFHEPKQQPFIIF